MAADVGGKQVATEAQRLHRINKTAPAQALYNRVLQKVLYRGTSLIRNRTLQ